MSFTRKGSFLISLLFLFYTTPALTAEPSRLKCVLNGLKNKFIQKIEPTASNRSATPIAKVPQSELDHLQRIVAHSSSPGATPTLFRGFAQSEYTDKDLVRYLLGDRRKELRSWDSYRLLKSKIEKGVPFETAIHDTDKEVADRIDNAIHCCPVRGATVLD